MAQQRASRRGGRVIGRLVAGLAAAVVLVAVLVGLPYVLLRVGANPIPDGVSSLSELWALASSPDNGQVFLGALTIVGWLAWATFALSVLVELPAQLVGKRSWRLPGLSLQQRLAAVLVAAVLAVVVGPGVAASASGTAAAFANAPPAAVAVHDPSPTPAPTSMQAPTSVQAPTSMQAPTSAQAPTKANGPTFVHTVQSGESLLGLAEKYDVSWESIAEANYGQRQPDGRVLDPSVHRVYPGWQMRIPGSVAAASPEYEIVRGDYLGYIAERYLGDFDRYPELAQLNPDLIDNPDHIEPTWQLTLPAEAVDRGPLPHAGGAPAAEAAATVQQPPPAEPETTAPETPVAPAPPVPVPSATALPTPTPTPQPSGTASMAAAAPPTPGASATPSVSPSATPSVSASPTPNANGAPLAAPAANADGSSSIDDSGVTEEDGMDKLAIAMGAASLLAALALTAVVVRRRNQHQHHRVGHRVPSPRAGRIETELRVAQQPLDVDRLDAALRSLSASLANRPGPLPDPVGAVMEYGDVRLLLAATCPHPPPPWIDRGDSWVLPADSECEVTDGAIAPLPSLTAVGAADSTHLLLDLERIGFLLLTGDVEQRAGLLRYVASELALNAWSDDVEVVLAGFSPREAELLAALNPDRVRVTRSVAEAASRVGRRVAAAATTLEHAGVPDALAGRVGDLAADTWMPQILLVSEPDQAAMAQLSELVVNLEASGRCAIGVVVASGSQIASTGRWSLSVFGDGSLQLPFPLPGPVLRAAGLSLEELARLAEIMQVARDRAQTPIPPASEVEGWAEGTDAAGGLLDLIPGEPMVDESEPTVHIPVVSGPVGWGDVEGSGPNGPVSTDRPAGSMMVTAAIPAEEPRPRVITAAIRQRRRQTDPQLDGDLKAWRDKDPTMPRIGILGPVTVEAPGPVPEQRQRFHAEIIVYLAQRGARGADRDQLDEALWPDRTVKDASRRVAITRARRWLGETTDGEAWLPDMGADRSYRLREGYLMDWHLFRRLRARGEAHGSAGIKDLRAALELVRGVPLEGADRPYAAGARNPYTWLAESDIHPDLITAAIIDTAHELAALLVEADDPAGVRWAVSQAWLADPFRTYDQPWRDLMAAQHRDGHSAQMQATFAELMRVRDAEVPEDLDPETYQTVLRLMPELTRAATPSR